MLLLLLWVDWLSETTLLRSGLELALAAILENMQQTS